MSDTAAWRDAGEAWGRRALDWAYLVEPSSLPAYEAVLEKLDVSDGVRLLDIACGSGLASRVAWKRGASVAGLDASESLVEIACARTPQGDFRVGDMFNLPYGDAEFDVATSFNGIWKGCEQALSEAHRVLRADGLIGLTFWGSYEKMGLLPYFAKLLELSPSDHATATIEEGDTGRVGVVEEMLGATGFEVLQRDAVTVINEWPDVDIAVRACLSGGPAAPVIAEVGEQRFRTEIGEIFGQMCDDRLGIRVSSELGFILAKKSG
ncbi:MAG: class I SAM-dependent methyltransferase [Actinomycetota bacterium]